MFARRIFSRSGVRFPKLEVGHQIRTSRSSAGVETPESFSYRSLIPAPEGVNPLFHAKWSTCYDLVTGHVSPFASYKNSRFFPALGNRTTVPLTMQLMVENFGEGWREGLMLWYTEVYQQMYPSKTADADMSQLAQKIDRLSLAAYSMGDIAEALTEGVPTNLHQKMVEKSVAASVKTYKQLGDEDFKKKMMVEADRLGWSPQETEQYYVRLLSHLGVVGCGARALMVLEAFVMV